MLRINSLTGQRLLWKSLLDLFSALHLLIFYVALFQLGGLSFSNSCLQDFKRAWLTLKPWTKKLCRFHVCSCHSSYPYSDCCHCHNLGINTNNASYLIIVFIKVHLFWLRNWLFRRYVAWILIAALYHLPSFQSMGVDMRMNLSLFLTIYFASVAFLVVFHIVFLGLWYIGLVARVAGKRPEILTIIQNCAVCTEYYWHTTDTIQNLYWCFFHNTCLIMPLYFHVCRF